MRNSVQSYLPLSRTRCFEGVNEWLSLSPVLQYLAAVLLAELPGIERIHGMEGPQHAGRSRTLVN